MGHVSLPGAIPLEEAVVWRLARRAAGERVAFTNGCFDIVHRGHVRLLTAAREAADCLIVAVNTDASLHALPGKAPGRPLVVEAERAELLAALEPVDRVVLFAEPTPLRVIVALRPDVLVKGADWSEDAIVGAAEVASWGGRIVRVALDPGVSTSAIVKRIRTRLGGEADR